MELSAEPAVGADDSTDVIGTESAWRRRAIERSTQAARLRAAKRVQRFLTSAREIIDEKGTTEFTVQEVVDHSKQSLRSFYQYFDGKHELLLGLFEEEIATSVTRLRVEVVGGDPLDRLRRSVVVLYADASPSAASMQPLFFEFAQRLMVDHPDDVARAYAPIYEYFVSIVSEAAEAGLLRPGKPRRLATIVMHAATTTASRSVAEPSSRGSQPITAEEVWDFCLHALVPDKIVASREAAASPAKRRRG
jgi:AcrR family transcriptional regulator